MLYADFPFFRRQDTITGTEGMKQARAIISALWVAAAQPSDPNVEHIISLKLSCVQSGTCSRSVVNEFMRRL